MLVVYEMARAECELFGHYILNWAADGPSRVNASPVGRSVRSPAVFVHPIWRSILCVSDKLGEMVLPGELVSACVCRRVCVCTSVADR